MGLLSVLRRDDVRSTEECGQILSRYKRVRSLSRDLNHQIMNRLPKGALQKAGKKLGMLRRGVLVFDSESESSVLMDYCLYDVRTNGRNAIERFLIDSPPDPDSDKMVCLRAMQHAIYSVFVVESVERGLGVTVRDCLSDERILVADMGFGSTAQVGIFFASRLMYHDGFAMTGGAVIPLGVLPRELRSTFIEALPATLKPDGQGRLDPAPFIRACLEEGCMKRMRVQDVTELEIGQQPEFHSHSPAGPSRTGRNNPCPCGSGKKYKHCCKQNRRSAMH